jgi:hypothetical protein
VLLELLVGDARGAGSASGEAGDGLRAARAAGFVDQPDVLEGREAAADPADDLGVLAGLGERGAGAGVAEDPLDLLGG